MNGVFLYLQGNKPITDYLQGQLNLPADGCIMVNNRMETEIPGVFAIGDMICSNIKQAVIAAADGAVAAIQADRFLNQRTKVKFDWKK